jgi:hypothetical protein
VRNRTAALTPTTTACFPSPITSLALPYGAAARQAGFRLISPDRQERPYDWIEQIKDIPTLMPQCNARYQNMCH